MNNVLIFLSLFNFFIENFTCSLKYKNCTIAVVKTEIRKRFAMQFCEIIVRKSKIHIIFIRMF